MPGWYNHYTAVGGDWGRMLISARLSRGEPASSRARPWTGSSRRRSAGTSPAPDPLDVFFDFLIEEDGAIGTIYAHHTEEDMNLALVQPWCSIGSDGSALAIEGPLRRGHPHPRSFGTFAAILGEYVRNRRLLRLEDAVRKMTSLNAAKAGLLDRGMLRPGLFADVDNLRPGYGHRPRHLPRAIPVQHGNSLSCWSTASSCSTTGSIPGRIRAVRCATVAEDRSDSTRSKGTHDRWTARDE